MSAKRPEPAPFELDAATARILPEPDPEPLALAREPETAASTPPPPSRLPWVLGFGLLGLLLVQAALFVEELVRARPIMGGVFALLLALVSASAALLALRSWRAVRRLHGRARHRARAARLIASELPREAAALLAEVARELPPRRRRPPISPAIAPMRTMRSPIASGSCSSSAASSRPWTGKPIAASSQAPATLGC